MSLKRSLHSKGQFREFHAVIQKYLDKEHAELVPTADLNKPSHQVFYLPMHAVRKSSSIMTKV